jgi:hypothetical protein
MTKDPILSDLHGQPPAHRHGIACILFSSDANSGHRQDSRARGDLQVFVELCPFSLNPTAALRLGSPFPSVETRHQREMGRHCMSWSNEFFVFFHLGIKHFMRMDVPSV